MSRHWGKILAAVAVGAAAGVSLKKVREIKARKEKERLNAIESAVVHNRNYGSRKAYIVGGGLAGLAAAAYLVRDCHFPGKQIVIFESEDRLGGSNDGKGSPAKGYACRGLRLADRENYENFWELFHTIPSLKRRGKSAAASALCKPNAAACNYVLNCQRSTAQSGALCSSGAQSRQRDVAQLRQQYRGEHYRAACALARCQRLAQHDRARQHREH